MQMVRIKDIAKQANVSPTTVSNVIHGNTQKVSKATIEKIQKLLDDVSYVPSMGARMLAENRSRIIGVLLGSKADKRRNGQGDAFANIIISALEDEIYRRNYYMMLHLSSNTEENLQLAATWNVEGLITIGLLEQENIRIQSRCPVPIISIDNYYGQECVANIGLDDYWGGYIMGQYLVNQGNEENVFLSDNDVGVDHFRCKGFFQALREAGLPADRQQHMVIPAVPEERISYYEAKLELLLKQDTLFFASDYYALEAMNYLQDKGIRIPKDISVAGFDDSEYSLIARPHLTTVHQDVHQKGIAAVGKLFAFIEGRKDVPMEDRLPVMLVIRDSVRKKKTQIK